MSLKSVMVIIIIIIIIITIIITPSLIYVSQGSVATRIRCGVFFNDHFHYIFTVKSDGERILKIGQQMAKLWQK